MTLPKPSGLSRLITPEAEMIVNEPKKPDTFQQLVRHGYVVLPPVRTVAIPREIGDGVISDDWGDF